MFSTRQYCPGLIANLHSGIISKPIPDRRWTEMVGFCILPLLLVLGLYILFPQATAIKAVHRFSWGKAAARLFLAVMPQTHIKPPSDGPF
jgi:hypothetical protein